VFYPVCTNVACISNMIMLYSTLKSVALMSQINEKFCLIYESRWNLREIHNKIHENTCDYGVLKKKKTCSICSRKSVKSMVNAQ